MTVVVDRVVEPDEIFYLNLTWTQNAQVADGQGRATILNGDGNGPNGVCKR